MARSPKPGRILIVDDHPLVRKGLAALFDARPDMQVCGEAGTAAEALARIRDDAPDLAIIDIRLPDSHGVELLKKIKARHPAVKTLVVSAYDEALYADRCLRAGALGYVNKGELQNQIIDAIGQALKGQRYLSPDMTQALLARSAAGEPLESGDPVHRLTDRELEVFEMIGSGMSTSAIAARLHLSVHTIDTHRENIRHKLGIRNSSELAQRAAQWVLLSG